MSGRYLIAGMLVAVLLASAGLWWLIQSNLPSQAEGGEQLFAVNCAGCHGANAAGSDRGPTLISPIYRPGHHGDAAFQRAVREGVPQHHWFFGDMPPVPSVSEEQVTEIIEYVRTLQRASGIN